MKAWILDTIEEAGFFTRSPTEIMDSARVKRDLAGSLELVFEDSGNFYELVAHEEGQKIKIRTLKSGYTACPNPNKEFTPETTSPTDDCTLDFTHSSQDSLQAQTASDGELSVSFESGTVTDNFSPVKQEGVV